MKEKIKDYNSIAEEIQRHKISGKKVVMVSGCFDLLHRGHLEFLSDAKNLGNVLVVSLGSDVTVKKLKGPERPVMDEQSRAEMLAALETVDYVVIAHEDVLENGIDFTQLLHLVKPDVFAINSVNRSVEDKRVLVESLGGKLVTVEGRPITSTTEILKKIYSL